MPSSYGLCLDSTCAKASSTMVESVDYMLSFVISNTLSHLEITCGTVCNNVMIVIALSLCSCCVVAILCISWNTNTWRPPCQQLPRLDLYMNRICETGIIVRRIRVASQTSGHSELADYFLLICAAPLLGGVLSSLERQQFYDRVWKYKQTMSST